MERVRHLIDGELLDSVDEATFASVNPFTRQPWADVALGSPRDAQAAVDAARRAFDEGPWPRLPGAERVTLLHRFADLVERDASELSRRDTLDMGRPHGDGSGADIAAATIYLREHAEHARLALAPVFPGNDRHHVFACHEPAGVVAAIIPWNFPVLMALSKLGPALAWGNTVVLKPAEQSPASATHLAQLALEAGIPPGVVNVVHGLGPGAVGEALASSPRIDRLTFTGSTEAGATIGALAAGNLVPATLECGGKGPNIILADADLDRAVPVSATAAFSNSGQVCVAASRVYAQRPIFEEFVARLVEEADGWAVGDPMEPTTRMGPLVSGEQFARVKGFLDQIPADGGTILTGGPVPDSWLVRPTIVTGLPTDARACREEIFGPVVTVTPFDTDAEAVDLANDSPFGLAGSLFTRDLGRAHDIATRVRVGYLWVNTFGFRDWRAPFGGYKRSGTGREGVEHSRDFYTEAKTVVLRY